MSGQASYTPALWPCKLLSEQYQQMPSYLTFFSTSLLMVFFITSL